MKISKYMQIMPDENQGPLGGKRTLASFMHIMTMAVSLLMMFCAFLPCVSSFLNAINSANRYYEFNAAGDAGILDSETRFLHFIHCLRTNGFLDYVVVLALILAEFRVYMTGYRSINCGKPIRRILWLLTAMLVIHTVARFHSSLITIPDGGAKNLDDLKEIDKALGFYYNITYFTIIPCWLYFLSHLCHLWAFRSGKQASATRDTES